jgi:hypothetical protein
MLFFFFICWAEWKNIAQNEQSHKSLLWTLVLLLSALQILLGGGEKSASLAQSCW